jgi:hypothetical protein
LGNLAKTISYFNKKENIAFLGFTHEQANGAKAQFRIIAYSLYIQLY